MQTVLTHTRGGHHPPLQPRSRSDSLGHGPERGLMEPSERAGTAETRGTTRAALSQPGGKSSPTPDPARRHIPQPPRNPAAGILPPARGCPRPRARLRRCRANTSCPRPGSLQRAPSPPADGSCPARRSPLPAPGRMVPARAHHLQPFPTVTPSPPRKYSAHKYGG